MAIVPAAGLAVAPDVASGGVELTMHAQQTPVHASNNVQQLNMKDTGVRKSASQALCMTFGSLARKGHWFWLAEQMIASSKIMAISTIFLWMSRQSPMFCVYNMRAPDFNCFHIVSKTKEVIPSVPSNEPKAGHAADRSSLPRHL